MSSAAVVIGATRVNNDEENGKILPLGTRRGISIELALI